ncbi:DUF6771 family protein [Novosphingobium sp. P6W]|uniref:DUF6771 family protein n=1 Tax=Novosphingobium sp. P6W TaxID=1609758 RepID=UPI001962E2B9|nr:DUF6771 family protein [Novosphingobium sp. P6W]
MTDKINTAILAVLQRAPEWVRRDLDSKDPNTRARAEDTLAAQIASALRDLSPTEP